jgi:hypothetical protein
MQLVQRYLSQQGELRLQRLLHAVRRLLVWQGSE